jgi:hypothetical protein
MRSLIARHVDALLIWGISALIVSLFGLAVYIAHIALVATETFNDRQACLVETLDSRLDIRGVSKDEKVFACQAEVAATIHLKNERDGQKSVCNDDVVTSTLKHTRSQLSTSERGKILETSAYVAQVREITFGVFAAQTACGTWEPRFDEATEYTGSLLRPPLPAKKKLGYIGNMMIYVAEEGATYIDHVPAAKKAWEKTKDVWNWITD